ncbi:hypothetical protein [Massilia psychrophila]|uniref:hypothetical protein n=1 Tax=Massilia psychrophila TaxID=1603353 RepID=UPI001E56BDA2|nr:hypothetical protein [Massilia psychrophila]
MGEKSPQRHCLLTHPEPGAERQKQLAIEKLICIGGFLWAFYIPPRGCIFLPGSAVQYRRPAKLVAIFGCYLLCKRLLQSCQD